MKTSHPRSLLIIYSFFLITSLEANTPSEKENLKEIFIELRELLHKEQNLESKEYTQRTKTEEKEIQELTRKYKGPATFVLTTAFLCDEITKVKVEAYLEASNTDPNTPLDWWMPGKGAYGYSLLTYLTKLAIGQQGIYRNMPFAIAPLEFLLERGGNPLLRPHPTTPSALELAQYYVKELTQKHDPEQKNDNRNVILLSKSPLQIRQAAAADKRQLQCAQKIIKLFNNHSNPPPSFLSKVKAMLTAQCNKSSITLQKEIVANAQLDAERSRGINGIPDTIGQPLNY